LSSTDEVDIPQIPDMRLYIFFRKQTLDPSYKGRMLCIEEDQKYKE